MGGVVAVIALALCACHKPPTRIYTDQELATLEERVLAEVAKTDGSCAHQELLDIETSVDGPCDTAISALRPDINVESNEVAKIDEMCSDKVLAAFGRAAAASPGCSPYQVGVRGEPQIAHCKTFGAFIGTLHATRILAWHALRETDHYVGLIELFMALGVAEDFGRGRIDLLEAMKSDSMKTAIALASEKLLAQSSLTQEQLGDATAMLDAAMAREPSFGAALEGDAVSTALHSGVASLKPRDWQPPGGRTDVTSWMGAGRSSTHDMRDDAGVVMAAGLERRERVLRDCPVSASLATCHANLAAHDTPTSHHLDLPLTDKHAVRVAMFPDDQTRHESQEEIVAAVSEPDFLDNYVGKHAIELSRLIALRLRLQVLVDGRCPSQSQLAEPPWSTLRAPALLGDSVRVTRTADALLVETPTWATTMKFHAKASSFPPQLQKPQPVSISCP